MIYQQPPKPSRLLNSNDNKRSPPNLQHIQVIYDSSGNTDHVIYHSQPQKGSLMEDDTTSSHSRRPLLEEKRSIDAKVGFYYVHGRSH
jgi:hypothetical protein